MIDRSFAETPARREAGMSGPDDDCGEVLDVALLRPLKPLRGLRP